MRNEIITSAAAVAKCSSVVIIDAQSTKENKKRANDLARFDALSKRGGKLEVEAFTIVISQV